MKFTTSFFNWILALVIIVAATGCSDDDKDILQEGYGFVQLRLYKSASYNTRADDRLNYLYEAKKIKITLRSSDNNIIAQTVSIEAQSKELAEYGMQSDKFQLLTGDYTLVNYSLYNEIDQTIYSGKPNEATTVHVPEGGLIIQDIVVNVLERGQIKFELVKDLSKVTRATGLKEYAFHRIMFADVTIRKKGTTNTTEFKGLKMTHETFHPEGQPDYYTSHCWTDSIVSVAAGTYEVTGFVTYFDRNKKIQEASTSVIDNEFIVKDNEVTLAEVPITLEESAGDIKDAVALKKIWEALDGPNWKVKWDFNRDIDLWTAQPGVQIVDNGRVASLNLEGVGAKGHMPAALGELTELRQLYLGTHSFNTGTSNVNPSSNELMELGATDLEAFRNHFTETYIRNSDPLCQFGPEFVNEFKLQGVKLKENKSELRAFPTKSGNNPFNYSNQVYSLPDEINNLKKLSQLYIAYSALETLPEDLSGLTALTDVEMFYNPNITKFPDGLATLPKLIVFTFSSNYNLPAEEMKRGLEKLSTGASTTYIQAIQMPSQPLEVVPDLTSLVLLNNVVMQNCGIKKFEKAFGKDFFINKINCSWNELEDLPRDSEGYFMAVEDQEEVNFSHNKFKLFPDIFDSKSIFRMSVVDFSYNEIEDIENGINGSGSFKGINAEQFFLFNNRLGRFPKEILKANSNISYLHLAGNAIEEIEEDAFEGDHIFNIVSLDLSSNKLEKLPKSFHSATFPYMYGVNLSHNRFNHFPKGIADLRSLSMFIFRAQRDEKGNRIMREWPSGVYNRASLRALYLGSNDLRKITDYISPRINTFEIADNPNIAIDLSDVCPYIKAGSYLLVYDPWQDIRGCDALVLER
ncbi:DUF4458 domain-containing protein [Bacteroides sp. 224]|uniref:DUF4458 domain-containing protein n=1 Tax=Bacteroides sp. 224 TaxID=2302936 RepID=UPI0013CF8A43|nr:DUF4458 domain-containing protein [Bacteroides sp. 224]NDV65167.1 DUF4458 domain-containing protein [Bacteroides sp. 224]